MAGITVIFEKVTVGAGSEKWLDAVDLSIRPGEQWAIVGPSGSGKTVLAHTLLGRHAYQGRIEAHGYGGEGEDNSGESGEIRIAIVEQQHRFKNLYGTNELYYQQRFNSYDAEQTMTVADELREYGIEADSAEGRAMDGRVGAEVAKAGTGVGEWIDDLHIRHLLSKPLIQLSNGENRRVQLAIALSGDPGLLILDNPFLGLDAEGRSSLREMISIVVSRGVNILLITSGRESPGAVTHVAALDMGKLVWSGSTSDFALRRAGMEEERMKDEVGATGAGATQETSPDQDFFMAVKMVGVTVQYGDTTILRDIDWEVRKGERWGLTGPNGAGKSTLLSLITADNPQAYANEIWLFDRRRERERAFGTSRGGLDSCPLNYTFISTMARPVSRLWRRASSIRSACSGPWGLKSKAWCRHG
jgi:molybdate transport system ATP-binding protein